MPDPVRSIIKTGIHHHHQHKHHHHQNSASSTLVVGVASAGGVTAGLMLLTLLVLLYRRLLRSKKTSPWQTAGSSIHRFSYKELKSATAGFSADNKLGHGGFGSVFRGHLRIAGVGTDVAVKVLEQHGTLQGEREFQTELSVMAKLAASSSSPSANVVGLLGFCVDKKRKKKVLVYEYMANRSLQEALFGDGKSGRVVLGWKTRLKVLGDTARALAFLHSKCDPAIIHGDVKPSNILLDAAMSARLADFGLARFHDRNALDVVRVDDTDDDRAPADGSESEDLTRRDFRSPESVAKFSSPDETGAGAAVAAAAADDTDTATETHDGTAASETVDVATAKSAVTDDDGTSLASAEGVPPASSKRGGAKKSASNPPPHARDWWWRQDGSGEMRVKDYVIEWISGEIRKDGADVSAAAATAASKSSKSKSKRRESREWWREEYCQELSNKKQQRKKSRGGGSGRSLSMEWWRSDMEEDRRQDRMMKRSRSRSRSRSSRMSRDLVAGDVLSSTPSMRGTVCYVAPEYGGGGVVSEKGDVYSFGVVILVVVAGRRPLQMAASPVMTELERANLISWARHLARSGNVLELVDRGLADDDDDFDRSEALLLITLALLCLQRLPAARPSMCDVVNILSGEMDVPALPLEFSPSPPYAVPFSRRRGAAGKAAPSPAPVDAAALTPTAAGLAS